MDIELRVARLERSLRRWKVAACLGAVVAVGVAARPQGKTIYAERFVVEGPEGVFRAVLGTKLSGDKDTSVGLHLMDTKGDIKIDLGTNEEDDAELTLTGRGKSRIDLYAWKAKAPFLILRDEDGRNVFAKP